MATDDVLDIPFIQGLCDRFASEFGYTVSVMGRNGIILASSARERIGNAHALAARVMAGETDEVLVTRAQAWKSKTMRPGCNTAMDFRGRRIANLGVAGNPKMARKFAHIIKFCILSLMEAHVAEAERQAAAAAERRRAIREIADSFHDTVQTVVPAVAGNAREVTGTAATLLDAVAAACAEARAVAEASEQASAYAATVTATAGQLTDSIHEVGARATDLTHIVLDARAKAEHTNASVAKLAEAALRITAVVELIRKIAAQTNLLALNATIEAARAGEAGKGFAVVAGEVNELAKRTAEATGEIGGLIQTIQSEVQVAVADIADIATVVARVDEISSAVAAAMTEQGASTTEIARSIRQVAEGTDAIDTGMRRLNETNRRVEDSLAGVTSVSGRLETLSDELAHALDHFTQHLTVEEHA